MACCCLVGRPLSFLKCCGEQSRPSAAKRNSESPSAAQKDGSVSRRGEVEETGELAVLMLWGNVSLTTARSSRSRARGRCPRHVADPVQHEQLPSRFLPSGGDFLNWHLVATTHSRLWQ